MIHYVRCPKCNVRIWKTRRHNCPYQADDFRIVRIGIGSSQRGSIRPSSEIIKTEYAGRSFRLQRNDRSELVRLFMEVCKPITCMRDAKRIRTFLGRFSLSNAEIHAVLLHLGFHYSNYTAQHSWSHSNLRHMKIDGYLDAGSSGVRGLREDYSV
jgi:hypothetical protein